MHFLPCPTPGGAWLQPPCTSRPGGLLGGGVRLWWPPCSALKSEQGTAGPAEAWDSKAEPNWVVTGEPSRQSHLSFNMWLLNKNSVG